MLDQERSRLASQLVDRHFEKSPELTVRYGEAGRKRCLEDAESHLTFLSESIAQDSPVLFEDYIRWVKTLLRGLDIPETDLLDHLHLLDEVIQETLPDLVARIVGAQLRSALQGFSTAPSIGEGYLLPENPQAQLARRYLDLLLEGNRHQASLLILSAVDSGVTVKDLYTRVFQPVLYEIGRLWQHNEITVAHEHFCTAATQLIMSQLYPKIFGSERSGHVLVAACVGDELHEIGLRMVCDFFEMEGWATFYLGANVPQSSILSMAREQKANLVALSTTMSYHLRQMKNIIREFESWEAAIRPGVIVGGYPFRLDPGLWKKLAADGVAADAAEALQLARQIVGGTR